MNEGLSFLYELRDVRLRLQNLFNNYEKIRSEIIDISSTNFDELRTQKNTPAKGVEKKVERLESLETALNALIVLYVSKVGKALCFIYALEKNVWRQILELKYVYAWDAAKCCKKLDISKSYFYACHAKAMREFNRLYAQKLEIEEKSI